MAAAASSVRGPRRSSRAPATAFGDDDGEEQHLNPFLDAAPPASSTSRVQFRKVASRARWVEEAGAAEVVESKGKLWLTTGVTRAGKLYYNVEEIGFLAERGALILLSDKDETIGIGGIYEKLLGGKYGCFWDGFQVYKHLKSLGFIIGKFGVPWTMKHSGTRDTGQSLDRVDDVPNDITKSLKEMQIGGISPSFQVYLPNSKFKKSSPGFPAFLLCKLSIWVTGYECPLVQMAQFSWRPRVALACNSMGEPPSRVELEAVENNFRGIPLKYCHVANGRVTFLCFDEVTLPSLP